MHVLLWGFPLFSAAVSIPRPRSNHFTASFEISEGQDRSKRTNEQRSELNADDDALARRQVAVTVRQSGAATHAPNCQDEKTVSYGCMLCGNLSISETCRLLSDTIAVRH